ncbi:DNA repair protein XRCC4-like [Bactrocera dorsalis]|uniref:DNA repair protein XRCC4-like n=1 Tax=Bactrocera dorsalis TaxID=27457 RepID=A0A6J0RJH4_BACDO|nr:DNA repair protein XRCC4-like [Bactrocera dorsalis]
MDSVYLKKILLKNLESDKKCYIYLHSEWDQKKLVKLYIKDSNTQHCYEGKIEVKDFEEAAEELDISLDEYLDVLKKVLTTDIGLDGFEIELDHENKIMRVNRTRDLHIMYVEIQLQEANKKYDMLDIALQKINNEKSKNEDQVIEKALSNAIDAVEKVLLEKEEWKEKMLAKFLLILNEKKNKIAKLEMELEKVSTGGRSNSNAQMDIHDSSDDDFNASTQPLTLPETVA